MSDIETLRHIIGELNKELEEKKKIIARLSKRDDELKARAEKAEAETDWHDAYMAEQQACVDALSRLDHAEDKIKELKAKIKELESKADA